MKKRIVSFLLALVMAVSLLPVSAFAVDGAYTVAKDAKSPVGTFAEDKDKSAGTGGDGPNNLSVPAEYEIVASYPAGYTENISSDTYVV